MNSTNSDPHNAEKGKLLDISRKIFESGKCSKIMSVQTSAVTSYYCDRRSQRLFESEIYEYDFSTPAELRNMLKMMWEYQGCEYMKEFAVTAVIAAFHNKTENHVETKAEIPSFIYNF